MSIAATMQGVSRESFASARENLDALVRAGDVDLHELAEQLFELTVVLDREPALRRALTDPARSGDDRADLTRNVFGSRISSTAADLLAWMVRASWSRPRDLTDTVEALGVEALLAAAQGGDLLDAVEDELFRMGRLVAGTPALRQALADRNLPADRRTGLIDALIEGKVADETARLLRHAVLSPRGRTFDDALAGYGEVAAERRRRLVATVVAAVPLTQAQRRRLAAGLRRIYGQTIHLNVEVEPDLIGGIRVEIGDEVIDGSVLSRLDAARRRLAG